MNAKKKIAAVALAACLAATAIVGGTLAYFTDTDKADNVFTVGNVDIELTEPNWNEDNAENMYPGQIVAKDPTVTNQGANPCLVRVKVEWPDEKGPKGVSVDYLTDGVLNQLGDNWVKEGDYYYCLTVLEPGDSTDALFDEIQLDVKTTNGDGKELKITVTAEAVQSQGFTGDISNVKDVAEWFKTCMGPVKP